MTKPLDSSNDTGKMSEDSGDQTQSLESGGDEEHISFRYKEIRANYLQTKANISRLESIEDNISKDVYDNLVYDQQMDLDELEPEMRSLEKQIKKSIFELTNDIDRIIDETGNNVRKLETSKKMYKNGIIDKPKHKQEVKAIHQRKKELEALKQIKNRELGLLNYAIEEPTVEVIQPPESIQSYSIKFLIFTATTQFLALIFWFLYQGLNISWIGLGGLIPYCHYALQIIVLFCVFYLFIGTRARSVRYFVTAGIFLIGFGIIFTHMGIRLNNILEPDYNKITNAICLASANTAQEGEKTAPAPDAKQGDTEASPEDGGTKLPPFLNYWAAVNLTIALFIFILASMRTFINGLKYDYREQQQLQL
ncbi:hypothetical protein QUF90_19850 [Desulfococcaceae bacterium HSG9]|nr:hypothetical protein [Desulfococcaceae bacterium HSG9]